MLAVPHTADFLLVFFVLNYLAKFEIKSVYRLRLVTIQNIAVLK